jgi:imidazolonepropionase-like amidohydrolase
VPTLAISHLTASQATNRFEAAWVAHRGLSHALCCRAEAASDVHATWFRKALDAGVRMALGSDIRPLKDAALLEMGLWVRDGATPWQTLVAATRHGAAVCGVGAELGTVEAGKLADLIVVAANPLEDITNVRHLQLVLKEGRVISDKRHLGWVRKLNGERQWRRQTPLSGVSCQKPTASGSHRQAVVGRGHHRAQQVELF